MAKGVAKMITPEALKVSGFAAPSLASSSERRIHLPLGALGPQILDRDLAAHEGFAHQDGVNPARR